MGDESLGGEGRLVEVAAGKAFAADIEFSRHADGYRLKPVVQHVDLSIGNRPAEGMGIWGCGCFSAGGTG